MGPLSPRVSLNLTLTAASYVLSFPAHLGFTYASTTPTNCYEMPSSPVLAVSNYINRSPICTFSTDTSGNVLMTVSNLRTSGSPAPSYYGLYFDGIITGPAAWSSQINSVSSTGTLGQTYAGSVLKETIYANDFQISYVTITSGVTLTGSPAQNGVTGTLTVEFTVGQYIPIGGTFSLGLPYQNYQYSGLGISPTRSMFNDQSAMKITGTYSGTSSGTLTALTFTISAETILTYAKISLGNTAAIAAGSTLTLKLTKILMPPSLAPISGIILFTGDSSYKYIEYASFCTLTNTLPGTQSTTIYTSAATMQGAKGVLEKDQSYQFSVYLTNDVPKNGYVSLTIPTAVGWPAGCTLTCLAFCVTSDVTLVLNPNLRLITLQGLVPDESKYILAPGPLIFQLSGFTNPASTAAVYFAFNSYTVLTSPAGTWLIDTITSMYIKAEQGYCSINTFAPTDGNYMIFGIANSWTVSLACQHAIHTDYSIQIQMPSEFYVISTSSCVVGGQQLGYGCVASNTLGQITISSFLSSQISAGTTWSFTVNAIRNPAIYGFSSTVFIYSKSSSGGVVDIGNFTLSSKLITTGNVLQFTVTPENTGVGMFPVFYDFKIQPSGEFLQGSYIVISLPVEVSVYKATEVEKQCSYNLTGFTTARINCKVSGNVITINSGFQFAATSMMTSSSKMVPPIVTFSLPQFWNPRSTTNSNAFALTIYSSAGVKLYIWNNTMAPTINGLYSASLSSGPVVKMLTAAVPQQMVMSRSSMANGALTDLNITIQTTNYLIEGDIIKIELPSPVYFSALTKCIGASNNLRYNQTCAVAQNQSLVTINLLLPLSFRRLQGSTAKIQAGQAFTLTLTSVKNPGSLAPTTSLKYFVYTQGALIETLSSGLIFQNTDVAKLNAQSSSVVPSDFRQSVLSNYTVTFTPVNYYQNMIIQIQLPVEVKMVSAVSCFGKQGTDQQNLTCSSDLSNQRITITDAVALQTGNPGIIQIVLSSLMNPQSNKETNSFGITTLTQDNYAVDTITSSLSVNFYCIYPCRNCTTSMSCTQCYQDKILFNSSCVNECPNGYYRSEDSCIQCQWPCATCDSQMCRSCVNNYMLQTNQCVSIVYWPFPFAVAGFLLLCCSFCCDILTCKTSRYKELFIALLAFPEFASWIAFCVFTFMQDPVLSSNQTWGTLNIANSRLNAFVLGGAAISIYICLNLIYACYLQCIYRDALDSYRKLKQRYPCSTCIFKFVSFFSFKFNLILISHFHQRKRYKGDYSIKNWQIFGGFSLVFICIPYPLMIFACSYFLYTNSIFSYAGFVAIEVIAVSTVSSSLLFFDAINSLRCRSKPVQPDYKQGEEEDEIHIAKKKRKPKEADEFGDDDSVSHQPFVLSQRQTQQQLQLLDQLESSARQQKEQIRLERDRIIREKQLRQEPQVVLLQKADSEQQIDSDDYNSDLRESKQYIDFEKELETDVQVDIQDLNFPIITTTPQQQQDRHLSTYRVVQSASFEALEPMFYNAVQMWVGFSAQFEEIIMTAESESKCSIDESELKMQAQDNQYELQQSQQHPLSLRPAVSISVTNADRLQSQSHLSQPSQEDQNQNRQEVNQMNQSAMFSRTQQLSEVQLTLLNPQFSLVSLHEEALKSHRSIIREQSLQSSLKSYNYIQSIQNPNSSIYSNEVLAKTKSIPETIKSAIQSDALRLAQKAVIETSDERQQCESSQKLEQGVSNKSDVNRVQQQQLSDESEHEEIKPQKPERAKPETDQVDAQQSFHSDASMQRPNQEIDSHIISKTFDLKEPYHNSIKKIESEPHSDFQRKPSYLVKSEKGRIQHSGNSDADRSGADVLGGISIADQLNQLESADQPNSNTSPLASQAASIDQRKSSSISLQSLKQVEHIFADDHRPKYQHESIAESSILYQKSLVLETSFEIKNKTFDLFYQKEPELNSQQLQKSQSKQTSRKQRTSSLKHKGNPVLDLSDSFVSSEGIVDHSTLKQQRRVKIQSHASESSEGIIDHSKAFHHAQQEETKMLSKTTTILNKSKPVLYSDKSESSIDEMMGDTPSNYNIANGRMDGKSQGLKAHFLLQNQVQKIQDSQLHLPNKVGVNLDQSRDGGWGNLNQPLKAQVQIIESANESMVSVKPKKKAVKTNKKFAESIVSRNVVGKSQALPSTHDQQIVKKNNYF